MKKEEVAKKMATKNASQKGKASLYRATGKAGKNLRSNMLSEKNEANRP